MPYDFWREATPALRAAVPRPILLLAEWDDPEMHRIGFDLTYAWKSYDRLKEVWKGGPASSFVEGELKDMQAMPAGGRRMRFTTNHDKTAWDDPPVTIFGRGPGARAAFVAAALLPGRPLLYNGQEVESPQKLGLFVREAIEWKQPNADSARAFYAQVLRLARQHPSLWSPELAAVETDASDDVIAYRRKSLIVLVNARARNVRVTLKGMNLVGDADLLSSKGVWGPTLDLQPYGAMVIDTKVKVLTN
jgi:hypothetical protein